MKVHVIKLYPQRLEARRLNFCMIDKQEDGDELILFENLAIPAAHKINERTNGELLVIWGGKAFEFSPDPVSPDHVMLGRIVAEVA
jgi:hypothetical protein